MINFSFNTWLSCVPAYGNKPTHDQFYSYTKRLLSDGRIQQSADEQWWSTSDVFRDMTRLSPVLQRQEFITISPNYLRRRSSLYRPQDAVIHHRVTAVTETGNRLRRPSRRLWRLGVANMARNMRVWSMTDNSPGTDKFPEVSRKVVNLHCGHKYLQGVMKYFPFRNFWHFMATWSPVIGPNFSHFRLEIDIEMRHERHLCVFGLRFFSARFRNIFQVSLPCQKCNGQNFPRWLGVSMLSCAL